MILLDLKDSALAVWANSPRLRICNRTQLFTSSLGVNRLIRPDPIYDVPTIQIPISRLIE